MRFAFSGEQEGFRRTVREVLHRRCPPAVVRSAWAATDGRVPGLWAALAEVGVVGLTAPAAHGGLGLSALDLVLVLEEAGYAALPEPLLETTAVGVPLLAAASAALPGGQQGHARWLQRAAAGEAVLAVGLEGMAHVAYAAQADLLLLQRGAALHAVPRERVSVVAQPSVDGARRLYEVAWEPAPQTLLCEGGQALRAAAAAFDNGALAAAAQLVGLGRRMLDMTVAYVKLRTQFGQPVGSFQAVKHQLADALLQLEFAAPTVYRAAYSVAYDGPDREARSAAVTDREARSAAVTDREARSAAVTDREARSAAVTDSAVHVSLAKAYAGEAAATAGRAALQCHGAIGYSYEHDLHLWLKRAWALGAAWGDAAWHRERIAQAVL